MALVNLAAMQWTRDYLNVIQDDWWKAFNNNDADSVYLGPLLNVGAYTILDFKQPVTVTAVRIKQNTGNYGAHVVSVDYSDDKASWATAYTETNDPPLGDSGQVEISSTTARYWRFSGSSEGHAYAWLVYGLELYGPIGPSAVTMNLAAFIFTPSMSGGLVGTWWKAFDESDATDFITTDKLNASPSVTLDFLWARHVSQLRVLQDAGNYGATNIKIDYSTDGVEWTNVYDDTQASPRADTGTILIGAVTARYWRFTGYKNTASYGWAVYSAEVRGDEIWTPPDTPLPPTEADCVNIQAWLDGLEAYYVPCVQSWLDEH